MPINVTSLSTLDPTAVEASAQTLKQLLNEQFPELDLTDGTILQQLILSPNSLLDVMNKTEIDNLRRSMSLLAISEDPALADDEIVDSVMSNYQVTRRAATAAQGVMAVVISSQTSTLVPATTVFTINDRTFKPDQDYTVLTNATLVTDTNERLLQIRSDGNYWFTINVVETIEGGNSIVQGSAFTMDPEISGYVEAYAAMDFAAGASAESNEALLNSMDQGIAARAMADRVSIESLLHSNFSTILDMSIIGFGDNEMLRDAYNIFGISHGGTSDIYVRTAPGPYTTKISIAMLPAASADGPFGGVAVSGNFILPPTAVPGFYAVEKITPYDPTSQAASINNFVETADRGIYTPDDIEHMPLLNTSAEARFTMFQGATQVHITDTETAIDHRQRIIDATAGLDSISVYYLGTLTTFIVAGASQITPGGSVFYDSNGILWALSAGIRFYDVYVNYIPDIKAIQDFVNDRDRRAPDADYLIKAAIPCTVSVDVVVAYNADAEVPDTDALKAQIVSDINAVKFEAASLPCATVVNSVHTVLGINGYAKLPLTLRGVIQLPSGAVTNIASQSALVIPESDAYSVTRRTVAFYATTDNVTLTLEAVSKWNV